MKKHREYKLPVIAQKDENGMYFVECPVLSGCYTQGQSLDEALGNIKEAIGLAIEDKENKKVLQNYKLVDVSLHAITV